jgi:hypothetical protein
MPWIGDAWKDGMQSIPDCDKRGIHCGCGGLGGPDSK